MTRKIIVILFVVCLDIAFILMIRGDFQPMLTSDVAKLEIGNAVGPPHLTSVEPIILQEEALPAVMQEPLDFESAGAASNKVKKPSSGNAEAEFSRSISKRRTKKPAFGTYAANEPFEGFTDTIIRYRNASYEKKPRTDQSPAPVVDCDPQISPAKRKRPIIKKAVPILKKPYDWLKDLVSE